MASFARVFLFVFFLGAATFSFSQQADLEIFSNPPGSGTVCQPTVYLRNKNMAKRVYATIEVSWSGPMALLDINQNLTNENSPRFDNVLLHPGEARAIGCETEPWYPGGQLQVLNFAFRVKGAWYPADSLYIPEQEQAKDYLRIQPGVLFCNGNQQNFSAYNMHPSRSVVAVLEVGTKRLKTTIFPRSSGAPLWCGSTYPDVKLISAEFLSARVKN